MPALIRLIRPSHWIKNLFVLAPVVFAGELLVPASLGAALAVAAAFCALGSGVYALNDVHDAVLDREHPVKRRRPVASGAVAPRTAVVLGVVALAVGLALVAQLDPGAPEPGGTWAGRVPVTGWALAYLVNNALYTTVLKRRSGFDVASLALGFAMRVFAGAAVLGLLPSRWLTVCCFCVALFLALGKRALELTALGGETAARTRPVSPAYGPRMLARALDVSAVLCVVLYAAYTVAPETVEKVGSRALAWTAPFAAAGVARCRQRIRHGDAADPIALVLGDRIVLGSAALWSATALVAIYGPR